jgi:RNA polymerase sigma-70 factor (ECF subfamily)
VDESLTSSPSESSSSNSFSIGLLERVRARDPAAWQRLVSLYGPTVYRWCRQAGLRPEDAADVVQEVFRSVATGVAEFRRDRPGDTFHGWLWTIARNKVHDHFRRQGRQPDAVGGSGHKQWLAQVSLPEQPDPVEQAAVDASLVHQALETIRGEFERASWESFWRMTIEGQTSAEIAADLGISKGAVRQAKYRILHRLRQELDGGQAQ